MILASTRQAVSTLLDESYFGSANFLVTYGPEPDTYFTLAFIPNQDFSFLARKGGGYGRFEIVVSPGPNILHNENVNAMTMEDCVKELPRWLKRLKNELLAANPLNREVEQFRQEMEQRLSAMSSTIEGFFTLDEAKVLSEKLTTMSTRLEALAAENDSLKGAVGKLTELVGNLQVALEEVNKATWFRMAFGKLTSFAKSAFASKEAREFALEAAKKLLLDGPK